MAKQNIHYYQTWLSSQRTSGEVSTTPLFGYGWDHALSSATQHTDIALDAAGNIRWREPVVYINILGLLRWLQHVRINLKRFFRFRFLMIDPGFA